MAFVTGDVVAVEGEELPFKVVFMQGDEVLSEWLVESQEDGEAQLIEALRGLTEDDEDEGEEDDEEVDGEEAGDDEDELEDA